MVAQRPCGIAERRAGFDLDLSALV